MVNSYNQEYFDQLDPITDQLKALGIVRSEIRTNEILDDAYAQLNDAKQQYQDGVNEFNEKIADAEKQILPLNIGTNFFCKLFLCQSLALAVISNSTAQIAIALGIIKWLFGSSYHKITLIYCTKHTERLKLRTL